MRMPKMKAYKGEQKNVVLEQGSVNILALKD